MEQIKAKENLDEISLMRPVLVVLVVLYHAMAIHTGNWEMPKGCSVILDYQVVGKFAYSFMLESFVFMSGYVWAFQISRKGMMPFSKLLEGKAERLLVPMLVFGVVYVLMFEDVDSLIDRVWLVLNGTGHLWFCLMLFWCFVIEWLLVEELKITDIGGVIMLIPMSLLSFIDLPFRLSLTMYYLFFFHLGKVLFHKKGAFGVAVRKKLFVFLLWLLFVILFFASSKLRIWSIANISDALAVSLIKKACILTYSTFGVIAFYATSLRIIGLSNIPEYVKAIGTACFGVYIFQQFVLKEIYYYTPLPTVLDGWVLPWVGFVTALIISIFLTLLIRRSKIGKKLI